jgi:hypothetical protein
MMSNADYHSVVYSKNVVEFVTVANEYCNTIENIHLNSVEQNLQSLRRLLPLLYLKATLLPENEKVLDEELEKYVSEFVYNRWQQRWLQALGEYDSYYEVFDPDIQFGEETVTASITENLMDIYQDLKDFMVSYSIGDEAVMNDALHECAFHFEDFWGQRLVNVLRAVHKLVTDRVEFDKEGRAGDENEIKPGTGNPDWLNKFWGTASDDDE